MKGSHAVSHVKVILEAVIYQDRKAMNCWVAICPMLGVATQSKTKSGAENALSEALYLWFETCIQEEILDSSLRKLGFQPITHDEARKAFIRRRGFYCLFRHGNHQTGTTGAPSTEVGEATQAQGIKGELIPTPGVSSGRWSRSREC